MKYALLFALSLVPLCGFAQDDPDKKPDPIDVAMDQAMDKDPSTAGMVRAYSDANTKWDRKMNSLYKELKEKMKPEEWTALVTAQKAWLAYRDAQRKSLLATYGQMEGTMWIPVSALREMDLTKDRALFLEALLSDVSER